MSGEKSCTTVRRRGCRLERKGLVEMAMDKMDVFLLRAHVVGHAHGGHKSTTQAAMHSQKKDGIRACEVRIRGSPRVCALRSRTTSFVDVGLVGLSESPRMLGWRGGSSGPRTHVPSQAQGRVYFWWIPKREIGLRPGRWGSGRTRTRLSPSHALEGRASLQASRQGVYCT